MLMEMKEIEEKMIISHGTGINTIYFIVVAAYSGL